MKILYLFILFLTSSMYAQTVYEYAQAYAQNPLRHEFLYNAGVEAARMRDYQQAYDYFTACVHNLNDDKYSMQRKEQAWYNRGNAAFQIKEYQDALASFEHVVECNEKNELARKKIEYIKQLLEQQEKQQEEKNESDEQRSDKRESDNKEQKKEKNTPDKNDQQNEDEKKGGDHQDEHEKDDEQENGDEEKDTGSDTPDEKPDDVKGDRSENQKEEQKQQKQEQQKQEESDQVDHQKQDKKQQKSGAGRQQEEKIPLTEQEQHILAAMEDLDKKMNEAMELQKLKKAQGSPYARNNW